MSEDETQPARSFGEVAAAYDRARPSYPDAAVSWLVGGPRQVVLDLGAGTGKLTEVLAAQGHEVLALDPLHPMLQQLGRRARVPHAVATAERLPVRSRSVDVVVCGQSFHWFDHDAALPEIARVLRAGGVLALAWNTYDTGIPWVRRLKRLLSPASDADGDPAEPLLQTPYFGFVDEAQFRFWQPHTARSLADLARSVSHVATMSEPAREETLAQVDELYAGYGRGHDGMQLPWITRCYRAVVRHEELPPEAPLPPRRSGVVDGPTLEGAPVEGPQDDAPPRRRPPEDPGTQLIDFR